jgi:hypothetical protein
MIKTFVLNKLIPISEIGNMFEIGEEDSFDETIEFSMGEVSDINSHPIYKNKRFASATPKIIKTDLLNFVPTCVKFRRDNQEGTVRVVVS